MSCVPLYFDFEEVMHHGAAICLDPSSGVVK